MPINIQTGYQRINVVGEACVPTIEVVVDICNKIGETICLYSTMCELYLKSPLPSKWLRQRVFLGEAAAIRCTNPDSTVRIHQGICEDYRSRIELGHNKLSLIEKSMRENKDADLCLVIHIHGTYSMEEAKAVNVLRAETEVMLPRSEWNKRLKNFGTTIVPLEISEYAAKILMDLLNEVKSRGIAVRDLEDLIEWISSKRERLFE